MRRFFSSWLFILNACDAEDLCTMSDSYLNLTNKAYFLFKLDERIPLCIALPVSSQPDFPNRAKLFDQASQSESFTKYRQPN